MVEEKKIRAIMSPLTYPRKMKSVCDEQAYSQAFAALSGHNNAVIGMMNRSLKVVTGPFINAGAVLLGGILGALLSQRLPERIRTSMTSIFGLASLGIGILLVIKCANLPVMVLSTLVGTLLGEACNMEKGVNSLVSKLQQWLTPKGKTKAPVNTSFIQSYVAIIVLFCASGTGIFGAMREGMTGDASILIAKAFLDFFTATIFACTLGFAVSAICVPMLLIQLSLAACASLIMPLTTPMMMADFTAVGGMLLLATGLRICGIKMFAVVNMLPALLLAMPISLAWTAFFA